MERACFKSMGVGDKVLLEECWERTGRIPLTATWIYVGRGSRFRGRWVAKRYITQMPKKWFAATLTEALRMVVSLSTTRISTQERSLMVMGVSRAFP